MKKAGELLFCSSNYNFRQSYRIDAGMLHAAGLPEVSQFLKINALN
jgi:hypothetical protein